MTSLFGFYLPPFVTIMAAVAYLASPDKDGRTARLTLVTYAVGMLVTLLAIAGRRVG